MTRIQTALLSVTSKTGLTELAQVLVERGVRLLASGGTASHLQTAGLPVTPLEEITSFREILDGRVKTLHPAVHAGLLADRDRDSHRADLATLGVEPIDLLVVNFYDFDKASQEESVPVEAIDIGGVALARAAAKNFAWVTVLSDPGEYAGFLDALTQDQLDSEWRRQAAARTFARVATYDRRIAERLEASGSSAPPAGETGWPDVWTRKSARFGLELRYGENPHQAAVVYGEDPPWGLGRLRLRHGDSVSYNNLLDTDAALALVHDLGEDPACVVVKHGNPCGAARGANAREAFEAALACDPVSAYGGIAAFNVPVERDTAEALGSVFLELVAAPEIRDDAVERLAQRKRLRVLEIPPHEASLHEERLLRGLLLVQERDRAIELPDGLEVVTKRVPTPEERRDLAFLACVAKHVRSNAIVLGSGERTLGIGAGQMSRVDSCWIAVGKAEKAGHVLSGACASSDGFFPFPDGVETLAAAGIQAIVQPGGSKRDPEVIEAADRAGVAMLISNRRHFRH